MGLTGGGDSTFTFKALIFGMVIMLMLPMMIAIYAPANLGNVDTDEVLKGYEEMTGQTASTKVSVWVLTGIYEPMGSNGLRYGYTEDGWLYGNEQKTYNPSQYGPGTDQYYIVYKDDNGVFRYRYDTEDYNANLGTGHRGSYDDDGTLRSTPGELYTAVNFDPAHTSSIFFTEAGRTEYEGGYFTYAYDGYRMAFQPISNYTVADQDGNRIPVVATTTSLSLIWYVYYTQSGLSGNLILSGSSSGLAYLNAATILSAFNSNTSSASFDMVFNGVAMNIIIKIDPSYLNNGYTVQDCYNMGYWSVMVTSLSADASAYTGTDYAMNPMKLLNTMIDLFTFNFDNYNMSPWLGALCSIIFAIPLYAFLLALCLDHVYLYILVGILGVLQAISAFWPF